jgi:hypothetical protein
MSDEIAKPECADASVPMIVFPAPDEPMNLVQTSGHGSKEPHQTEQKPGGNPEPPKPDMPGQDQPGPVSPEPDYLPEGPKDPLPRVWPAEPETQ